MHIQQYHSSKASTTSATSITSTTPIKEEYDKTTFSKRISEAVALIVAIILALMIGHKLSHGQNVTNHGTDWLICDFSDVFTPSILSFQSTDYHINRLIWSLLRYNMESLPLKSVSVIVSLVFGSRRRILTHKFLYRLSARDLNNPCTMKIY